MIAVPNRQPDLEVTVFGAPKTKGSVKAFVPRKGDGSYARRPDGSPLVVKTDDTGVDGKAWMGAVADRFAAVAAEAGFETVAPGVPVVVELVFYRPRPASHYGTGRNAGVLKGSAPMFPATRPDVDKLTRAVLDALKGVAWHDDGQVVGAPPWKAFGTPARLEMRLWVLPATIAQRAPAQPQLAN